MPLVTITLIEGGSRLLGAMPEEIGVYTQQVLERQLGVRLLLGHQVTGITSTSLSCKRTRAKPEDAVGRDRKREGFCMKWTETRLRASRPAVGLYESIFFSVLFAAPRS